MTLAAVSILLFCLRFFLLIKQSEKRHAKWLKIAPHIVDTLLLTAGVTLAVMLSYNPAHQPWLLEKLIAVVAYIFTGFYTLKWARNNIMRYLGFIGCIGWLMLIVRLAMTKSPLWLAI